MKRLFYLLMSFVLICGAWRIHAFANVFSHQNEKVTLKQGLSFALPEGWHYWDNIEDLAKDVGPQLYRWIGPNDSHFNVFVGHYDAEYRKTSIDDDVTSLYNDTRGLPENKDVRYVTVDQVRGVHDQYELKVNDITYEFSKWKTQYFYHSKRYVIALTFSCPAS